MKNQIQDYQEKVAAQVKVRMVYLFLMLKHYPILLLNAIIINLFQQKSFFLMMCWDTCDSTTLLFWKSVRVLLSNSSKVAACYIG